MFIVKADKGKMTLLSKVQTDNVYPMEMFILGDKLVLMSNKFIPINVDNSTPAPQAKDSKIAVDGIMPFYRGYDTVQGFCRCHRRPVAVWSLDWKAFRAYSRLGDTA